MNQKATYTPDDIAQLAELLAWRWEVKVTDIKYEESTETFSSGKHSVPINSLLPDLKNIARNFGKYAKESISEIEPLTLSDDTEQGGINLPKIGGISQFIIPLLLALVVSWGMINALATPKTAYQENITRIELDLVAIRETDENLRQLIVTDSQPNTEIAALREQVNVLSNSLSNYATLSNLSSLSNLPANIDDQLNSLSSELKNISSQSIQDIADLKVLTAALKTEINKLDRQITDSTVTEEDIVTRWTLSIYTNIIDVGTYFSSYPSRIEEAGDYSIDIWLSNLSDPNKSISNLIIHATFTPQRNDRIWIDEEDISLDTYSYPYVRWDDVEITVRSDGTVKRITFISEAFTLLNINNSSNPLEMELDFTLEYE